MVWNSEHSEDTDRQYPNCEYLHASARTIPLFPPFCRFRNFARLKVLLLENLAGGTTPHMADYHAASYRHSTKKFLITAETKQRENAAHSSFLEGSRRFHLLCVYMNT